jgi:putative transposase
VLYARVSGPDRRGFGPAGALLTGSAAAYGYRVGWGSEDRVRLAVKNMMAGGGARKRGLNRSLADASLGHLLRLIDYKATWYGSTVVKADRWHPSSKTCSGCGAVKTKLCLAERQYVCTDCGLVIDRDLNAAINLARLALAAATDPSAGFVTGGADRKTTAAPSGQSTLVAMKPEPDPETDTAAGGSADPKGKAA